MFTFAFLADDDDDVLSPFFVATSSVDFVSLEATEGLFKAADFLDGITDTSRAGFTNLLELDAFLTDAGIFESLIETFAAVGVLEPFVDFDGFRSASDSLVIGVDVFIADIFKFSSIFFSVDWPGDFFSEPGFLASPTGFFLFFFFDCLAAPMLDDACPAAEWSDDSVGGKPSTGRDVFQSLYASNASDLATDNYNRRLKSQECLCSS